MSPIARCRHWGPPHHLISGPPDYSGGVDVFRTVAMHNAPPAYVERVAGTGQPFLLAFCAALVGRAREASITRYGPSVAHVSRQHLLHQHIRGLDANPDHALPAHLRGTSENRW